MVRSELLFADGGSPSGDDVRSCRDDLECLLGSYLEAAWANAGLAASPATDAFIDVWLISAKIQTLTPEGADETAIRHRLEELVGEVIRHVGLKDDLSEEEVIEGLVNLLGAGPELAPRASLLCTRLVDLHAERIRRVVREEGDGDIALEVVRGLVAERIVIGLRGGALQGERLGTQVSTYIDDQARLVCRDLLDEQSAGYDEAILSLFEALECEDYRHFAGMKRLILLGVSRNETNSEARALLDAEPGNAAAVGAPVIADEVLTYIAGNKHPGRTYDYLRRKTAFRGLLGLYGTDACWDDVIGTDATAPASQGLRDHVMRRRPLSVVELDPPAAAPAYLRAVTFACRARCVLEVEKLLAAHPPSAVMDTYALDRGDRVDGRPHALFAKSLAGRIRGTSTGPAALFRLHFIELIALGDIPSGYGEDGRRDNDVVLLLKCYGDDAEMMAQDVKRRACEFQASQEQS